jgi:putative addiction module killer protein
MTRIRKISLLELRPGYSPFERWYQALKDQTSRAKIFAAITKLANPGYQGFKAIGAGVYELRIFIGPGYRVYFGLRGNEIVVLIHGGDKSSQTEDINYAKKLWKQFKDENSRYKRDFSD